MQMHLSYRAALSAVSLVYISLSDSLIENYDKETEKSQIYWRQR